MNIIEQLPDDIILYIYIKCLKRYRMNALGELIKRIDLNKYKFLENYIRRIPTAIHTFNSNDDGEINYRISYQLHNLSDINRSRTESRLRLDDDMMCIEFTINDLSLRYNVEIFRLKKIEDMHINSNSKHVRTPSIYYTGNSTDYDWEIVRYEYEI